MQLSELAKTILKERVLQENETPEDMFRRVARAVSVGNEEQEKIYYDMLSSFRFLPNSPCLMNAGTDIGQLCACFVLPIGDSMESIFSTLKDAAMVQKSGGGTGFSFSRLRPEGDKVNSTGGVASGPVSFLKVFNAATNEIEQGGRRRGASLAVLNVDHPDILKFIRCKKDTDKITNFNISVGVTDQFMSDVQRDEEHLLVNPRTRKTVASIPARKIWDKIVQNAWETGEPGILFLDVINDSNPTPALGKIEACNPCGETNLLPYEPCVLGSIDLSKFVKNGEVDYQTPVATVRQAVRFLDDVISTSTYPIPKIEEMAKNNRKIGIGVMGWANMLYKLGVPYDSDDARDWADEIMNRIDWEAKAASEQLAEERGTFPNFSISVFKDGTPRRNAAVTSIAPTGTLADIAGTTYGIEPEYALVYTRRILDGKEFRMVNQVFAEELKRRGLYSDELLAKIESNGGSVQGMKEIPEDLQRVFKVAHDIAPSDHVKMQAAFQGHVEQSISKTINLPEHATPEQVANVFMLAWELECKGVTVYRDGARPNQTLSTSKHSPAERPETLSGKTRKFNTGCGSLYVTVNRDLEGDVHEVFAAHSKNGGCVSALLNSLAKMTSIALRSGVDPKAVMGTMLGQECGECENISSCADAIGLALQEGGQTTSCNIRGGTCESCG